MVNRSAIWFAFSPAISSAAVTNTSAAPGAPNVLLLTLAGITLANHVGTGFVTSSFPAPAGVNGFETPGPSPSMRSTTNSFVSGFEAML